MLITYLFILYHSYATVFGVWVGWTKIHHCTSNTEETTWKVSAFGFHLKTGHISKKIQYFARRLGGTSFDLMMNLSEYRYSLRKQTHTQAPTETFWKLPMMPIYVALIGSIVLAEPANSVEG